MPPLPRDTCPVCDREVAMRRGGQFREHDTSPSSGDVCWGSGLTLVEAVQELARQVEARAAEIRERQ